MLFSKLEKELSLSIWIELLRWGHEEDVDEIIVKTGIMYSRLKLANFSFL